MRKFTLLLIVSLPFFAYGQQPNVNEIEKLKSLLTSGEGNDSLTCAYYGEMGYYQIFKNYDSSLYYLNKAIDCSKTIKNVDLTIRYNCFLGMAYAIKGKLDYSIESFTYAAEIAKRASRDSILAQTNYGLGNVYHLKGDMSASLKSYLLALTYFETKNYEKNINSTKANISDIYLSLKEYNKAKPLIIESLKYYEQNNSKAGIRNGYTRLSKIYIHENKLDSALIQLLLAKKLAEEINEKSVIGVIDDRIGNIFYKQGKYPKAIDYMKSAIQNYKSLGEDLEELIVSYSKLGLFYAFADDFKNSKIAMNKAANLLMEIESVEYQIHYYQYKYKIDSLSKNYYQSLISYQNMTRMNDSLLNEQKAKQLAEFQTKYETEKKDSEIEALSQQATIQALELKQKNQGIIIGLVLFLLLSFGAYFFYIQKASKNKRSQIELEQRFLRSQLNPHFIFNALLAIQNYMLKNDAKTAGLYLSKFAKLMREILENSRREFILVGSEVEMLTNYLDIHKLRLNNSFNYDITIDDNIDLEADSIPPMFVQPFVENAIEHGIINTKDDGLIELNFVKTGDYISIEIKDNGDGIFLNTDATKEHTPLASTIIKERMELFNKSLKNKIQLVFNEIKNEQGEIQGTKVELKVPFSYI